MIPTQTCWRRNEISAKGTLSVHFADGNKPACLLRITQSISQLSTEFGVKNSAVTTLLAWAVYIMWVLPMGPLR